MNLGKSNCKIFYCKNTKCHAYILCIMYILDSAIPIPSSLRTNQLSLDNRFNVRDDGRASDSDMEVDNTHENTTGG